MAKLIDYKTGEPLREATAAEQRASIEASARGGAGAIEIEGRWCFVETEAGDVDTLGAVLDDHAIDDATWRAAWWRWDTAVRLAEEAESEIEGKA